MQKFLQAYLMRQYGVKSVANKALGDISHSLKHFCKMNVEQRAEAQVTNVARLNLFVEMAGLEKDDKPWTPRKTNFHLHVVGCLTGKAEAAKDALTLAKVVQLSQKRASLSGDAGRRTSGGGPGGLLPVARDPRCGRSLGRPRDAAAGVVSRNISLP